MDFNRVNEDDATIVAISSLLLGCTLKTHGRSEKRKRRVWVKNWIKERESKAWFPPVRIIISHALRIIIQ